MSSVFVLFGEDKVTADGTNWLCAEGGRPRVSGEDQILVATCGNPNCRAEAIIDPGPRPSPRLMSAAPHRLEEALRCVCGARCGTITPRPFWGPRPAMAGGVYLFVV